MYREGIALESLESVGSRRFLPHALLATLLTIVAPALVVVALSPLSGIADVLLSAVLATGLSVAAGSVGATLWTRRPQSREIPFGDLMLWAWVRRVGAERRLARTAACETPLSAERDLAALRRLVVVFEARDGFHHGHSGRVARHAERIARRLGLPEHEVRQIEVAAAVHDIGMVGVPRSMLAKRDELTPEERALVRRHAVDGAERVAAAADDEIAALVRHRHERVDGRGYPDGLAGDEIPLGARIIAVADSFDELVSPAPRRPSRGRRNALDELSARAGVELDAAVVAAFAGYYSGSRSIAGVALVATAPQRALRWLAAAPATVGSLGGSAAMQGVCAAGTAALATACLTGLPTASSDRDGESSGARQRADRAPAADSRDLAAPVSLAAAPATGPVERDRHGSGRGDGGSSGPPDAPIQAPAGGGGRDGGGGGVAPGAPRTDGGAGGGTAPPATGDGGAGGPPPEQPVAPIQPPPAPPVQPSQAPVAPATQVLDPVLGGVGDAVPPLEPVTDAVEDLLAGLTGDGQSR